MATNCRTFLYVYTGDLVEAPGSGYIDSMADNKEIDTGIRSALDEIDDIMELPGNAPVSSIMASLDRLRSIVVRIDVILSTSR